MRTSTAGFVALSASIILTLPLTVRADLGSCEFRIHSAATGNDILVCQTANNVSDCGTWPTGKPSESARGFAQGKASGDLEFRAQECAVDRAIGACLLPNNSTIYFYEGLAQSLAVGCGRMQGEWKDIVHDKEAQTLLDADPN